MGAENPGMVYDFTFESDGVVGCNSLIENCMNLRFASPYLNSNSMLIDYYTCMLSKEHAMHFLQQGVDYLPINREELHFVRKMGSNY